MSMTVELVRFTKWMLSALWHKKQSASPHPISCSSCVRISPESEVRRSPWSSPVLALKDPQPIAKKVQNSRKNRGVLPAVGLHPPLTGRIPPTAVTPLFFLTRISIFIFPDDIAYKIAPDGTNHIDADWPEPEPSETV